MTDGFASNEVAIVGVGFSEITRRSDQTLGQLAVNACHRALDDAGLTVTDIDGISNYPNPSRPLDEPIDGVDVVGVHYLSQALGLENLRWACSITGGTVTATVADAVHALAAGACNYALVWRAMHNPAGAFGRVTQPKVGGKARILSTVGVRAQHRYLCHAVLALYGPVWGHPGTPGNVHCSQPG